MSDEADEWEDYTSGPFCVHWCYSGDCSHKCGACGHPCNDHSGGFDQCSVEGCACTECTDDGAF